MIEGWLGSEGALGLRGRWDPIGDHEVDALIETIYAARRRDTGRLVEIEGRCTFSIEPPRESGDYNRRVPGRQERTA